MFPLFLAHVAFWVLLLVGGSELGVRNGTIYVVLWVLGYVGSGWLPSSNLVFVSYVAMLDVALVLHVFKGDIRLH